MKNLKTNTMLGFICHDRNSEMTRLQNPENNIYFAEVPIWSFGDGVTIVNVKTLPHEQGKYQFENPSRDTGWAIDERNGESQTNAIRYYHTKANLIVESKRLTAEETEQLRKVPSDMFLRTSMTDAEVVDAVNRRMERGLSKSTMEILSFIDHAAMSHRSGEYAEQHNIKPPKEEYLSIKQQITDNPIEFLEAGIPKYPYEDAGSKCKGAMKAIDDLAHFSRHQVATDERMQVLYVLNFRDKQAGNIHTATSLPPYGEDGKFIDGVNSACAIVVRKDSLDHDDAKTGIAGVFQIYHTP